MKFKVGSTVECTDLPKEAIKEIRDHFTITNPKFAKKMSLGLSKFGTDQYLRYYENIGHTGIEIPVGGLQWVLGMLQQDFDLNLSKDHIEDNRVENSDKEFFDKHQFQGQLREYQQPVEDHCMEHSIGTVQAKTGAGKSVNIVSLIMNRGQNTLLLVHTKELASQMIENLVEFGGIDKEDIGFIGSGEFDMKPITVGLLQTVRSLDNEDEERELEQVQNYFGQVITDETHIIAAKTYYEAMCRLPAKYKYGFSGTVSREDGLTRVIHWANGPMIYEVPDEALDDFLIKPSYEQVDTEYYFPIFDTSEYQTVITDMAEDEERNQLIYETFLKEGEDKPSVFLCKRLSHVSALKELIGDKAIALTSSLTKKQREENMKRLIEGDALHAISTWGLFSTGVNIPRLTRLYMAGPMGSKTKLKQAAGRLMRMSEGKDEAKIIDFVDRNVWLLNNQSKKRKKVLTNL